MNYYDELDDLSLQLRMDYGFLGKRLDVFKLARKLHIRIIRYSQLDDKQRSFIENQYSIKDALTISRFRISCTSRYILYNDSQSFERIRFSIAHEIKHIVYNEKNPTEVDEAMADHFGRVILAPPCILIQEGYAQAIDVASDFGISLESAGYALKSARKRRDSPKFGFSKTEREFLRLYKDNQAN